MWRCLPLNIGELVGDKPPNYESIYVVSSCPRGHASSQDCSTSGLAADSRNYLHDVPLMDAISGVWYRNIYCAVCHGASENLAPVNMTLKCSNNTIWDEVSGNASYQGQLKWTWQGEAGRNGSCYLQVTPPLWPRAREGLLVLPRTIPGYSRPCVPVVDSCPATWDDQDTRNKCHSYAYFVMTRSKERNNIIYKNTHCGKCNDDGSFVCYKLRAGETNRRRIPWSPPSMSMVMNFQWDFEGEAEWRRTRSKCSPPYGLFDAINKRCQHLKDVCARGYHFENHVCVSNDGTRTVSCPKSYLSSEQFEIVTNGSLLKFNDNLYPQVIISREYYEILDNGVAEICLINDKQNYVTARIITFSDQIQGIISCICFAISIICLILHIFTYITVSKLRNLPGKNLFALSWSLLLAQILFLFGSHPVIEVPPDICVAIATLTHFFFLASFFWMNVLSFDIWRKFTTRGVHCSSPVSLHRKYAVYAWVMSGVIVGVSILVDRLHLLSEYARPNYGRDGLCWIGSPLGLGIFFAAPIICIVISNIFLFTTTVIKIKKQIRESASYIKKRNRDERLQCKRRSGNQDEKSCLDTSLPDKGSGIAGKRDQLRAYLYIKLFMIMGLTWIFGIVNGFVKVELLWYPFIVLNGLQGAFIFLVFDCKRAIATMVWERMFGERYKVPEFLKPSKCSTERSTKTDSMSSTTRLRRISGYRSSTTGRDSVTVSVAPDPSAQHLASETSDRLVMLRPYARSASYDLSDGSDFGLDGKYILHSKPGRTK